MRFELLLKDHDQQIQQTAYRDRQEHQLVVDQKVLHELKALVMVADEQRKDPQHLARDKQDRQRQQIALEIGKAACAEDRRHGQDDQQSKDVGGGVRTQQTRVGEQDRDPRDDTERFALSNHEQHHGGGQENAHKCRDDILIAEGGTEIVDSRRVIAVEQTERIDIEEVEHRQQRDDR